MAGRACVRREGLATDEEEEQQDLTTLPVFGVATIREEERQQRPQKPGRGNRRGRPQTNTARAGTRANPPGRSTSTKPQNTFPRTPRSSGRGPRFFAWSLGRRPDRQKETHRDTRAVLLWRNEVSLYCSKSRHSSHPFLERRGQLINLSRHSFHSSLQIRTQLTLFHVATLFSSFFGETKSTLVAGPTCRNFR